MSGLREALESAFNGVEEEAPAAEVEATPAPEVEAVEAEAPATLEAATPEDAEATPALDSAPGRARDEKGRFSQKPEVTPEAKPAAKPEAPKPVEAVKPEVRKPAQPTPPSQPQAELRAPQSWKPAAREAWAKLPPDVRQEVARREKETAVALQKSAEASRFHDSFRQLVSPYEALIRAEGSEPLKAVGNLLQTAAALRTAPPAHKAQLVAQLVKSYGIPIDALDSALAGQPAPQQAQPQSAYRDPRVDQLFSHLQTQQQQRTAELHRKAQEEASSFSQKAEFFEDVREDVADMLELAARRGLQLSLEDAYNRAVRAHPEISEVLRQREAATSAAKATASTQRARAAASSVRSQPATSPTGAQQGTSIREQLEAAFGKAGR